jgi:hypothetical protein
MSELLYILCTTISPLCFSLLFLFDEFKEWNIDIFYLILSSLLYKVLYMISDDKTSIKLNIATKIDYLCIFNVIWSATHENLPFSKLWSNLFYGTTLFSILIGYKFFYSFLAVLFFIKMNALYQKDIYVTPFYIASSSLFAISYYFYTIDGWNLVNSWCWHLAICACLISVKASHIPKMISF